MNSKPIPRHAEMVRKGFDLTAAMDAEINACRDRISELEALLAARRQPDAGVVEETYCLSCRGEGTIWTGIDEAPTTLCRACEGSGYVPKVAPASPVPASVDGERLWEIARQTGLRRHLHGVNATDARALLTEFVSALASKPVEVAPEQRGDSTLVKGRADAVDGDRYRFLRGDTTRRWWALWGFSRKHRDTDAVTAEELDAAIDAAIAEAKKGEQ
jgi:hypothetical protein